MWEAEYILVHGFLRGQTESEPLIRAMSTWAAPAFFGTTPGPILTRRACSFETVLPDQASATMSCALNFGKELRLHDLGEYPRRYHFLTVLISVFTKEIAHIRHDAGLGIIADLICEDLQTATVDVAHACAPECFKWCMSSYA